MKQVIARNDQLTSDIIKVTGLVKNYGSFRALNKLDLTVERGEVHSFLVAFCLSYTGLYLFRRRDLTTS